MHTQVKIQTIKRWAGILGVLISLAAGFYPAVSGADENISGRIIQHTMKVDMVKMSDVPGHVTGTSQNVGLVFFSNGEIATTRSTSMFDLVNGKGSITVNRVHNYQDGSTRLIKATGNAIPVDGGKKVAYEGTYEWIGGTGRFDGMMGKGTYKGERLGSPDTGSDTYIDFSGIEWKKASRNEAPVMGALEADTLPKQASGK